jgi:prevent-host-death family protein
MALSSKDIVPLSQMRAHFTELADEARQGHEKIITKNGESYIALVDPLKLDYYHQLERANIHLCLLHEVQQGLNDIEDSRTTTVEALKAKYGR